MKSAARADGADRAVTAKALRQRESRPDPAVGVVEVHQISENYLSVDIGRKRYVKRFNLSDAEARQLMNRLAEQFESR